MSSLSISSKPVVSRFMTTALVLGVAVGGTACTRTGPFSGGNLSQPQTQPAPLAPAPSPTVQQNQLPPPSQPAPQPQTQPQPTPPSQPLRPSLDQPSQPQQPTTQPKPVITADAAKPVTVSSLLGAWTVAVGGKPCVIFMSSTKWSGGNRAATKQCGGTDISDVQAWKLSGKQVVLVDKSGSQAATLYRSSDKRFDGSTSRGKAISFSR